MQKVVISIHVSHYYWHSHLFVQKQFLWSIAVIRAASTSDQGWLLALWCYTTVQLSAWHWPSQYVSFGDYPLVWITYTFQSCHRQTTEPPKLLTIKGKGHISVYCLPKMKTHSTFLIHTIWLVEVCISWSATSSKSPKSNSSSSEIWIVGESLGFHKEQLINFMRILLAWGRQSSVTPSPQVRSRVTEWEALCWAQTPPRHSRGG